MATRLERSGSAMMGELKRVTILFADIRGSTEMVDRLDVDGALEVLAPLLKGMMDAVHQFDGFVNRTIGDGIMALFGAPLASEDHAVLACQAAVALRSMVQDVASEVGEKVELRIGLHSGEVLVHSIGHDLAMSFDAMGKAVHVAARLESSAEPGTIRISAETFRLARNSIEVRSAGRLNLKGIEEPVECYDLLRTLPRTRWQARQSAGQAPIVGRAAELEMLDRCREDAAAGRPQLVTVTGNPGLGKSRLLYEFAMTLPKDWIIFEASGQPNFVHAPHSALASILRRVLNLAIDEEASSTLAKLDSVLKRLGASATSFEPLAAIICGAKSVPGWMDADPREQSARLRSAVADMTLRQAKLGPLCLMVEDLHWMDSESASILEALPPVLGGEAVVIVTSEREPGTLSARLPATKRIRLQELDETESRRLIDELLGNHPSLLHIKQHVRIRGAGNPLFIEELVQALQESGEIIGASGSFSACNVMPTLQLPTTVQDVLAARIDRLEASQKVVLQAAAVVGSEFPYWLLTRMLAPEHVALEADLESLNRQGYVYRAASGLEAKYAFKHDMTREAAYDMIPRNLRKTLHGRIVDILEQEFKDRLDDQADALAVHAACAELWQKAFPYQLRAARRAARRGANRDCIAIVDQALQALDKLPGSEEVERARIDFRLLVVTALEPLGLHERARENLLIALTAAEQLQDQRRIAAIECQLALAWWRRGEHVKAGLSAEKALGIAMRLGDGPLIFAARHSLGIIDHQTGRFEKAVAHLEFCNSLMTAQDDERRFGWAAYPSVILRTFLADSLFELGRLREAREIAEAAVATAIKSGHLYSIVQINQVRARVHMAEGEFGAADAVMAETWRSVTEHEMLQLLPIMATRYGEALVGLGKAREALEILLQPENYPIGERNNTYGWGQLYCAIASALLSLGRLPEARESAERSLKYAMERGELPQVAYAHAILFQISVEEHGTDHGSASQHRRDAEQIALDCGMKLLAARVAQAGPVDRAHLH